MSDHIHALGMERQCKDCLREKVDALTRKLEKAEKALLKIACGRIPDDNINPLVVGFRYHNSKEMQEIAQQALKELDGGKRNDPLENHHGMRSMRES